MDTWKTLALTAHRALLANRGPSAKLVAALHDQPPATPRDITSRGAAVDEALPELAHYAAAGDRDATLLAAALLRYPLQKISRYAPKGDDPEDRAHTTLTAFWAALREQSHPTARSLYWATLRAVIAESRQRGDALPLSPDLLELVHEESTRREDLHTQESEEKVRDIVESAHRANIVNDLDRETLLAVYNEENTSIRQAANALTTSGCTASCTEKSVARRAERAVAKLRASRRTVFTHEAA